MVLNCGMHLASFLESLRHTKLHLQEFFDVLQALQHLPYLKTQCVMLTGNPSQARALIRSPTGARAKSWSCHPHRVTPAAEDGALLSGVSFELIPYIF